ncbi:MAG: glycoside hydrolase family 3 C-terminal domain-containing protein [Bacteroidales bacterium]|nr:glycoside hydrolase family 3 C-terminal domain-containing protein [Bacteroidales bacterium]
MKFRYIIPLATALFLTLFPAKAQNEPYRNPDLSPDERARDLLSRMTVEEKIDQMHNNTAGTERLGIRPYDWWNEALHGVARAGQATVFPQAIGLAATFDDEAVRETFEMVSDEARAKYHDFQRRGMYGGYRGLTFWTPNINIFRDPRWGRGMETYGEDPFLTSRMGVAVVKGLQGDGSQKYDKTHACAKHYAVHSGPEWNRHSYDARNISERDLRETYLPAFKALVTEGNVKEVMCAYNRFEGEPCCANKELLTNILRNEWGYDNMVVSDCGAISDFYGRNRHETHASAVDASADAVLSGTDLECGGSYLALKEALAGGLITEEQIDRSVFRMLRARFQLGMFDHDSLVSWASIPLSTVECDRHRAKALEMARKSMTLLTNRNNVLPLSKKTGKVAVVGPNANDSVMLWANYNGVPSRSITILEGIRAKLPAGSLIYEKGCDHVDNKVFVSYFDQCAHEGKQGFKAVFRNTRDLSGEVAATAQVSHPPHYDTGGGTAFMPGVNLTDFSARFESVFTPLQSGEVTFTVSADDGCRVWIDGEEIVSDWKNGGATRHDRVFRATQGKRYDIVVEYYQAGGAGTLKFDLGLNRTVDYRAVAEKVKDADVIVFAGGLSPSLEGEEMGVNFPGFRNGDRTDIDLPEVQRRLLQALKETGKPVVFVLCSGSALALSRETEMTDAILAAWYPGQEGGAAVADVLFGDFNPAGRLPVTFYASSDDLPDFEDYGMKRRTYRYFTGEALFPFGHGLSYTTFACSKARLSSKSIGANRSTVLHLTLKNTGAADGEETVQVYVRNLQDAEGPLKSLRAFRRVFVGKGASVLVSIELPPAAFEFFNPATQTMETAPGKYEILYGGTSDDRQLQSVKLTIR